MKLLVVQIYCLVHDKVPVDLEAEASGLESKKSIVKLCVRANCMD